MPKFRRLASHLVENINSCAFLQFVLFAALTLAVLASLVSPARASAASLPLKFVSGAYSLAPGEADLSVTKTGPATVRPGENITYPITVTNNGGVTADAILTDVLPKYTTFVSLTSPAGITCDLPQVNDPGTVSCPITGLAANASAEFSLTLHVSENLTGVLSNTAEVEGTNGTTDTRTENNSYTAESQATYPYPRVDLAIVESIDNPIPNVGDQITLTTYVDNYGPDTATGVTAQVNLPAGLVLISYSPTQGNFDIGTGTWNIGTIASGARAVLPITLRVTSPTVAPTTAIIALQDQPDLNYDNNASRTPVNPQEAALAISKVAGATAVNLGEYVVYTTTVTNYGPAGATGVIVSDALPNGLTFSSATPSQGTYDPANSLWTIGAIDTETPVRLTITAMVATTGQINSTAQIVAADQFDNSASDNAASAVIYGVNPSDLELTKTSDAANYNVGDIAQFTITVKNNGPLANSGIVVSDVLPAGLAFVAATPSQGTYDPSTGDWTVSFLANQSTATLEISARIFSPDVESNTASITNYDQFDPDPSNNSDTTYFHVLTNDLSLAKITSNNSVNVGDSTVFTVTLTNNGPDGGTGIKVTDALPGGLTFVSASPSQGTYNPNTGEWNVGSLGDQGSASLEVVATVSQPGSIVNTATISASDQYDPDATDNSASVTINGIALSADVGLTKTVNTPQVQVGAIVSFTVTAGNSGPDAATGIVVTDQLPAGLVFVTATPAQGTYNPLNGAWTVGTLANGGSSSLVVVAQVAQAGTITNTATTTDQTEADPTPANNAASASVTATAPITSADVEITKTADNSSVEVGQNVTYTVTAHNNGPAAATGIAVTDQLPGGLALVSASPGQGTYDPTSGNWTVGALANGDTATLTIVARVDQPGTITNTAAKTAQDQDDPNGTNNVASVSINGTSEPEEPGQVVRQVALPADLVAQLRVTPDQTARISPTTDISYTITVKNIGPGKATEAVVKFPLDPSLELGYATFSDPAMWVSQIVTGTGQPYMLIRLPSLESRQVVSGSIIFHPAAGAADGTGISTRFAVSWNDDERSAKQSQSNAVRFTLSTSAANLDLNQGQVQRLSPQNQTLVNGQTVRIEGDFFAPNEIVTFWYTDKNGNSQAIGSQTADASGRAGINFTPEQLPVGDSLVVAAYGNRSDIYGGVTINIAG